jgi:glycosyltransferase involved in cell wall biosynthesis
MSEMLGAYVARLNLLETHNLGVANKVRAQAQALSSTNVRVDLYFPGASKIFRNEEVVAEFSARKLWARLNYYLFFYLYLARQLRGLSFVYMRYQRSSPLLIWVLGRIRKHNPGVRIFVELPSYPYDTEQITLRDKLQGWVDRASRHFLRWHVDHIVTFSRQKTIFGIPTLCTDNGVDVDRLEPLPVAGNDGPLRLLGLANLSFWHGYDRVIAGLAEYAKSGGSKPVVFDIIGVGNELERLKADVRRHGLESQVRFWGVLQGGELTKAMAGCHIGISSIGMHRLNVDTSNLKSREFCARGLPFVIAYEDRDFDADLPFVFRAPASEAPVDIGALVTFYEQLRANHRGFSGDMRLYAQQRLTWQAKMAPVSKAMRSPPGRQSV